jgi:hypothetical protein
VATFTILMMNKNSSFLCGDISAQVDFKKKVTQWTSGEIHKQWFPNIVIIHKR